MVSSSWRVGAGVAGALALVGALAPAVTATAGGGPGATVSGVVSSSADADAVLGTWRGWNGSTSSYQGLIKITGSSGTFTAKIVEPIWNSPCLAAGGVVATFKYSHDNLWSGSAALTRKQPLTCEPGQVPPPATAFTFWLNTNSNTGKDWLNASDGNGYDISFERVSSGGGGASPAPTPSPTQTPSQEKPTVRVLPHDEVIVFGKGQHKTVPLKIRATGPGGTEVTAWLFSGSAEIEKKRWNGQIPKNKKWTVLTAKLKNRPDGTGPFYLCATARTPAGVFSDGTPKSSCQWLSIAVPISVKDEAGNVMANGCGTNRLFPEHDWASQVAEWIQNALGNDRYYGIEEARVQIARACDLHDLGYAGLTVRDELSPKKKYIDFRKWSRLAVDAKFKRDIRTLCDRYLTMEDEVQYLKVCKNGATLAELATFQGPAEGPAANVDMYQHVGATTYFDIVRTYGGVGYDADVTQPGTQNVVPSLTNPNGGARDNR